MGNDITKITDYTTFLDLLIQQFKDKPNFVAILTALSKQCEDVEDAIFEFFDQFNVDNAEGDQLDIIGNIVGIDRNGLSDTDYRSLIRTKIIINNGSGEFEIIIKALTDLYNATTVYMYNYGNAKLYIWVDVLLTSDDLQTILTFLPAGVELFLIVSSTNPFVFYDDPDGSGFGKINDEEPLLDSLGNPIYDSLGNPILITINESCSTGDGGEFATYIP